jgi:excisionase family DNA binding protein
VADRIVSIAEAARLTGLSKAAIRARVDHGELRAIRRGGVRRISVDELAERGLLDVNPHGDVLAEPSREILDLLQEQAEEIGRLRAELRMAHARIDRMNRRRGERRP